MHALWHSERGSTALEFALVTPLVLVLIVGIIDIAVAMMTDAFLERSVRQASRLGITTTIPAGMTRDEAIRKVIQDGVGGWAGSNPLHIETRVYASFANIGQPEPCGDTPPAWAR